MIWKTESQSQSKMQVFKNAFLKTRKRCILVTCDKVKDSVTSEHPLHSLLKASVTNLSEFVLDFEEIKQSQKLAGFGYEEPGYMEIALQELPVTQAEVKINKGELIKKRKVESVSSIEMMIQFPFDWVLQYGAGIKPANSFQLPSIFKTLGDVSHKFVEELFTDAKFNIASANVLLLDFDKRIYKCMEECGAILLLDEHRFEKERFISRLKKSSKSLLALVEQNHLSIEGIEYKADGIAGILDDQNFMGYIDLFLKDDQDKPVIFDLKWTPSDKKYQKKVREGKSVQLSIYNALIKDAGIGLSKTAYFLLSSGKLITGSNFIGENVKRIDARYNEEEILEKVENSVNYRRQQFEDGIIEEGEEGQLTDLAYFIDQNEKSLIEIEGDSTGKKKKKNFYSSYNVLKGNIN